MNVSTLALAVMLLPLAPASSVQLAAPQNQASTKAASSTDTNSSVPQNGLFGNWKTSGGAVITSAPCPAGLCLRVATLSPDAPGTIDHLNPDASLRDRPICNMEIGSGFSVEGDHATNGHVYDPMSGKTYKATLKLDNPDTLKLRGYIGFSAIGRTETWQRTTITKPCN